MSVSTMSAHSARACPGCARSARSSHASTSCTAVSKSGVIAPCRRRGPTTIRSSRRIAASSPASSSSPPDGIDEDEDLPPKKVPTPADFFAVRAASDADLADVLALAKASGVEWNDAQIEEEMAKGNFVLATRREGPKDIVGVCCAWVVAGEVQILEVATHPSARNQGVGGLVLRAACDRCPEGDAFLEVRASNEPALGLYHKLGFKETGRRREYYANGEDAVLMRMSPKVVSARELTRLMAGLTREEARRPAPKTPEEKQRGDSMHPQDYPRDRPAFRRDGDNTGGNANTTGGGSTSGGGFKMRNRIRGRGR